MALIDPVLGVKLIFLLGTTNVLFMLAVALTCRCLIGIRFVNEMLKKPWYRRVFGYHCWYWRFFFLSVLLHVILVYIVFGIPSF